MPCSDNFNYYSAKNKIFKLLQHFANVWTIKKTYNSSQPAMAVIILAGNSMHILKLSINECGSMQGIATQNEGMMAPTEMTG